MGVYSFGDVQATLTGPGGNIQLGNGAGASEEGITVAMKEEKNDLKTGAGGEIMHSLRMTNVGRITIRLLKTSPANAQLSQLYNAQRASSALWGKNVLIVSDTVRGDVVNGSQMAFVKQSDLGYSKDGNMNEWMFEGNVDELLGTGVPDLAA